MLILIVMEQFSKAEYCEVFLLYGECRWKSRSAAMFYQRHFPVGLHLSHQTILIVVKSIRKAGCVTNRARSDRLAKVGRQDQLDEALAYALEFSKYSTR